MNATGDGTINFGPENGTRTINGNVTINGSVAGPINLRNLEINGNLTVNTPNATVNNGALVRGGQITINAVGEQTWNEKADGNKIIMNAADRKINVQGNLAVLTLKKKATVEIEAGKTVNELTVSENAGGTEITNNGSISTLHALANIESFEGTVPEKVEGEGLPEQEADIGITYSYNETKISVKTTLPNNLTIGEIDSLSVSLLDNQHEILATNTLNDLGFFLHGTEKNTFNPEFTKVLVEGNIDYYKSRYEAIEGEKPNVNNWTAGAEIQIPSDGNVNIIDTSFIQRASELKGNHDPKVKSAWDQSKFAFKAPGKVLVKYTKDGITYYAIKDVSR